MYAFKYTYISYLKAIYSIIDHDYFFILIIGIYKVTKDENLWKKIYHVKFKDLIYENINYVEFNGNITHCPNCYIQEDNLKIFKFCQSEYLNHTWLNLFQVANSCICVYIYIYIYPCRYICV
jgi:hypothetical protein